MASANLRSYFMGFHFVGLGQTGRVPNKKPRTLDKLEQQIRDTFACVPADYFRKGVESVSSSFWTCAQNAGVCIDT